MPAALAACGLHRPPDPEHLGRALALLAPLPRGHPHVWQAGHAARTRALAALLLSGVEGSAFWLRKLESVQ